MIINNKIQKGSKLVKNVVNNLCLLKFSFEDPENYDEFDPVTNFCVIVPFRKTFLFVEVSGLDNTLKIHLKLRGVISNKDLDVGLNTVTFPESISVGELTLHENIIVNYHELLRMDMKDYKETYMPYDPELFNMRDLDIICSHALQCYLCNLIFVVDKDFYTGSGLTLLP